MGLQITKTHDDFGMDLDYWKVGEVKVDWHQETCKAILIGFVNQTQRDAGKLHVKSFIFQFNDTDFTFDHASSIVDQLYTKIKLDAEWSSAVDVLD